LVSGGWDGQAIVWDVNRFVSTKVMGDADDRVNCVDISEAGNLLATGARSGVVKLWDTNSGKLIQALKGHTRAIKALVFISEKELATGAQDGLIKTWDVKTADCTKSIEAHRRGVLSIAYARERALLASGGRDGTVRAQDLRNGKTLFERTMSRQVFSVRFSPDGSRVAASSAVSVVGLSRGEVVIWSVPDGEEVCRLTEERNSMRSISFGPNGKSLVTGGTNGPVRIWDVDKRAELRRLGEETVTETIYAADYSPERGELAVGTGPLVHGPSRLLVFDLRNLKLKRQMVCHSDAVTSLAFAPDGRRFVSGSRDGTAITWQAGQSELEQILKGHEKGVYAVGFSSDGHTVLSGSGDVTVKLWDADSGRCRATLDGSYGSVMCVAMSPDGRALASGGGRIRRPAELDVWKREGDKWVSYSVQAHEEPIRAVAFARSGTVVATASNDGTIKLWKRDDLSLIRTLNGHRDGVKCLSVSADGKALVSGSSDRTVRLWDVETKDHPGVLGSLSDTVFAVGFVGAGVFAAGREQVVFWDRETRAVVARIVLLTRGQDKPSARVEWIALTKEGYYACSEGSDTAIRWRIGGKLFSPGTYRRDLNRPETVRKSLSALLSK